MTNDIKTQAIMYSQQLQYLKDGVETLMNQIKHLPNLKRYAYIIHDKDGNEPHIHVMMVFTIRVRISSVAQSLNQPMQQFEVMTKRGNSAQNSINNGFAYLIHATTRAKIEGKHQYSTKEVHANFDYPKFIKQVKLKLKVDPKTILNQFNNGEISKIEAIKQLHNLGGLATQHYLTAIDKIDTANRLIKQNNWIIAKENTNEPIKVIWLFGKAGVGKTRFAKHIAVQNSFNGKYDITGSTRDLFQSITTEESLIIDELRPQDIAFNDLLKLLDNYNYRKNAPSRYTDKPIIANTIIITSPYSPIQFYKGYKLDNSDTFKQLQRRINMTVKVTDKQLIQYIPTISEKNENIPIWFKDPLKTPDESIGVIPITNTTVIGYASKVITVNKYNQNTTDNQLELSDYL